MGCTGGSDGLVGTNGAGDTCWGVGGAMLSIAKDGAGAGAGGGLGGNGVGFMTKGSCGFMI